MLLPPSLLALVSLILSSSPASAAETTKPTNKPCSLHSPSTGSFYDLRPLQAFPPTAKSKDARTESWHAKGYDYGANFSINFCGPVVEDLSATDVSHPQNVSAFYNTTKGEIFSIGQTSMEPVFRGKKLVLNYTGGDACPDLAEMRVPQLKHREVIGDDDDDDDDKKKPKTKKPAVSSGRKKSTIMSFHCDRDPTLTEHPQISFIGSLDHCTYFFEVRSRYACGGAVASNESGSLGPGGVFGVILAIALIVYLVGGCVYQRTVVHQRGWRQCPNYGVWAGCLGFIGVSQKNSLA